MSCNADAHGDVDGLIAVIEARRGQLFAQAFGQYEGTLLWSFRQQDGEFLTPVTDGNIGFAQRLLQ